MKFTAIPRPLRGVALGLALSAVGGLGLVALAQANPGEAPAGGPPGGRGMGMHGPAGPGMSALLFAGPMGGRLLDEIDATAQQREQLKQIGEAAMVDLKAQREAAQGERAQMMQAFTQPTIDAKAVETLRKQMLARHDTESKRVTQAMIDSAKVLTVDQRIKMAELVKQHAERMPPPPHAALERGDGPVSR